MCTCLLKNVNLSQGDKNLFSSTLKYFLIASLKSILNINQYISRTVQCHIAEQSILGVELHSPYQLLKMFSLYSVMQFLPSLQMHCAAAWWNLNRQGFLLLTNFLMNIEVQLTRATSSGLPSNVQNRPPSFSACSSHNTAKE